MHEIDDEIAARDYNRRTAGTYVTGEMTSPAGSGMVPPPEPPNDFVERQLIKQYQERQARRHIKKHSENWEGADTWISNMTDDVRENLPSRIRGLVAAEQKDPSLRVVTIGGEPPLDKIFLRLLEHERQVKALVQFVSKLREQPTQLQTADLLGSV